jgi:hypothetical protein
VGVAPRREGRQGIEAAVAAQRARLTCDGELSTVRCQNDGSPWKKSPRDGSRTARLAPVLHGERLGDRAHRPLAVQRSGVSTGIRRPRRKRSEDRCVDAKTVDERVRAVHWQGCVRAAGPREQGSPPRVRR